MFDEPLDPPQPEPFAEGELIGYGWMPAVLDIIKTASLVIIAIAVCVR